MKSVNKLIWVVIISTTLISFSSILSFPVDWSINPIWSGSATLRQIDIDNHLKSPDDDTFRIFTVQSASPRFVLLFTDVSSSLPMQWRCETLEMSPNGSYGARIGDVDRNGVNDLVYIRSATPYYLFRRYWDITNSYWVQETICQTNGANWALDVADADNNGFTDDIIYSAGVTSSSRVYRAYWTGSQWQNSELWSGDGRTIQGIAIGNFDQSNGDSNEIVVATAGTSADGGRVVRIKWNGLTWDTLTLWKCPDNASFTNVAIGDIDSTNPGNEIVLANGLGPGSMIRGAIIELFGSGTNWYQRPIFIPQSSTNAWGLAIGDVMTTNPGEEVIFANSLGPPYEVRTVFGSGDSWSNELIFAIGGATYGIVTGDVNKHRTINQEIAIAGNSSVYEAEQLISGNISISNTTPLLQQRIIIAPNPTKNLLSVKCADVPFSLFKIALYNSVGRLIKSFPVNETDNTHCLQFNIADIPNGVYILRFVSKDIKEEKVLVINR
ncbi:MAG: T9SS type A sorting domain-containing protein [candidate division WOR-3 bacterium]